QAIIFSQFQRALDETKKALGTDEIRIKCVEYAGGAEKIRQALRDISKDPDVHAILMPLKGDKAAGLTMTMCNVEYLMDPTIIPGLEDQAINRIHRMGQKRPTTAVRVVAEGTVERHVLELQEKKRAFASRDSYLGIASEKRADLGIPEWQALLEDDVPVKEGGEGSGPSS
ncbi:hypothetical protein DFJ74DRAFT_606713, partial [Hyaloraphidium curvatum]